MPLKITIHADLVVSEDLISKKEYLEFFKRNRAALIEFLKEDNDLLKNIVTYLDSYCWIGEEDAYRLIKELDITIQ